MLGTIQLLFKTFFLSFIVSTIFTLKEKNRFFSKKIFTPLTCDSASIKKKHISYFCPYFNISKAHLNQRKSIGCVSLLDDIIEKTFYFFSSRIELKN